MLLNQDLREFLELLNLEKIRCLIVGGWAYNFYAIPRATGDIDLFLEVSEENEKKLRTVLKNFGFGSTIPGLRKKLLAPHKVIMLGEQPNRIDLLTNIDGVSGMGIMP